MVINEKKINAKYHFYTLKNGLRAIIIQKSDSLSSSVGVFVKSGASNESKKDNGMSHLLEHLCFNGTSKRPNQEKIANDFESIGALYNAFTSRDYTGYYTKVATPYFDKAFDIIADIYLNPIFQEKGFEEEKSVIVEEINMYEDDPRSKVSGELIKLLYGDSPIGRDIAGTKENVLSFTRDRVIKYRNEHYITDNTFVIVAGNVDIKKTKMMIESYFGGVTSGEVASMDGAIPKKLPNKKTQIVNRDLDQFHIAIGMNGFPYGNNINYSIGILMHILGGSMSSRLFREVRNRLGAAYYIHSSNVMYATHGFSYVQAGIAKDKLTEAVRTIFKQFDKIIKNGVTLEELRRAKQNIVGSMMLGMETSDQLISSAGSEMIKGNKIEKLDEIKTKIQKVALKDIKNAAKKIFEKKNIKIALVGPCKDKNMLEKFVR